MSSFNTHARKVRNPDLPIPHRHSSLRCCILRLVWLTGQPSYHREVARFNELSGINDAQTPSSEQLLAALATVEQERNVALAKVQEFAHRRKQEKHRRRHT